MTVYTLESQTETMLRLFYHDDIELMIKRVNEESFNYTEHRREDILKYLQVIARRRKIIKLKESYENKSI